jgi:hypothetical protein
MKTKTFVLITILATFSVVTGGLVATLLIAPAWAQDSDYVSLYGRSLTIAKSGTDPIRASLFIDNNDQVVLALHSGNGFMRVKFTVDRNGTFAITDGKGNSLSKPRTGLRQLSMVPGGGGKADATQLKQAKTLKKEIKLIWLELKQIRDTVNLHSTYFTEGIF